MKFKYKDLLNLYELNPTINEAIEISDNLTFSQIHKVNKLFASVTEVVEKNIRPAILDLIGKHKGKLVKRKVGKQEFQDYDFGKNKKAFEADQAELLEVEIEVNIPTLHFSDFENLKIKSRKSFVIAVLSVFIEED